MLDEALVEYPNHPVFAFSVDFTPILRLGPLIRVHDTCPETSDPDL